MTSLSQQLQDIQLSSLDLIGKLNTNKHFMDLLELADKYTTTTTTEGNDEGNDECKGKDNVGQVQ